MTTMIGHNGGPTLDDLEDFDDGELAYAEWQMRWLIQRRPKQIPPEGDWTVWNLLAGRGFGKTRLAAEWLAQLAISQPGTRWLVSAPTAGDLRGVCFEGESGLISVIPPELLVSYNKSLFELTIRNPFTGETSFIKGISAEEPERFRGWQFHGGWLDELAAWKYLQASWDMMMFTMRLGAAPKIAVTTTPKPKPLISALAKGKLNYKVVTVRGSSIENFGNLAKTYQQQISQYEGTQLGRQEIYGEIIDAEESGIIKRSWLPLWPAGVGLPALDEIILSLDTAFTEESRNKKTGDPDYSAMTAWGIFHSKPAKSQNDLPPKINMILLDAWKERMGMPELIEKVKQDLLARYGEEDQKPLIRPLINPKQPMMHNIGRTPDTLIIEEKGSGISLIQMLARENIHAFPYNPGRQDKLARLHSVSHIAHGGHIYLLESRKNAGEPVTWANDMLAQVCTFSGKGSIDHDDFVDSFSQALRYFADRFRISVTVKPKPLKREVGDAKPKKNPYSS